MKITMIILKLLFLGALFIISNHDLALNNSDNRTEFIDMYNAWIEKLFNQGAELTGYILKSEWLPEVNGTFFG